MNVIIFGPPGAGKGTQAQNIVEHFSLYQVSTGDLLRNEIKNQTSIGKKIEEIIKKGDFVNDEIVNKILENFITNKKYRNRIIFDGYPRNIKQAENLEIILNRDNQSLNFILYLKVTRDSIEKRILGRIVCQKCNKTMNEFLNQEEIDSHICGKNFLIKRDDDNIETIISRYDEYMRKTKPVLDFYFSRSYFHEINGDDEIQVITDKIKHILKG